MRKLRVLLGLFAPMALLMSVAGPAMAAPPASLDVSTADCTTVDGQGSITVTGFTVDPPDQHVAVNTGFWVEGVDPDQFLVITVNGTYPLDPGDYNWGYADRIGGGGPGHDFTIGACPEPTQPPPITGWKVSTADCTTVDGQGSITVTGFTGVLADTQHVAVNTGFWVEGVDPDQFLVITVNGTYPLDPGDYNWGYADRIGGGGPGHDFTIGACAAPAPAATPVPAASGLPNAAMPTGQGPTSPMPLAPVLLVLGAVSAMALLLKPKRR